MTIYERIKYLREQNGLSQQDLAEKVGFKTASAVNKIELGLRDINQTRIIAFAKALGTTPGYLMGWEESPSPTLTPVISRDVVTFAVIGDLAAGYDQLAVEDWRGETVEIPSSYLKGHSPDDFVVLSVRGDSMFPAYQNGDKVLILRQECVPYSGAVGAVFYKDEMATLKKVEYGDGFVNLQPINPNFPATKIYGEDLEHFSVFGVPKLLIRDIND